MFQAPAHPYTPTSTLYEFEYVDKRSHTKIRRRRSQDCPHLRRNFKEPTPQKQSRETLSSAPRYHPTINPPESPSGRTPYRNLHRSSSRRSNFCARPTPDASAASPRHVTHASLPQPRGFVGLSRGTDTHTHTQMHVLHRRTAGEIGIWPRGEPGIASGRSRAGLGLMGCMYIVVCRCISAARVTKRSYLRPRHSNYG